MRSTVCRIQLAAMTVVAATGCAASAPPPAPADPAALPAPPECATTRRVRLDLAAVVTEPRCTVDEQRAQEVAARFEPRALRLIARKLPAQVAPEQPLLLQIGVIRSAGAATVEIPVQIAADRQPFVFVARHQRTKRTFTVRGSFARSDGSPVQPLAHHVVAALGPGGAIALFVRIDTSGLPQGSYDLSLQATPFMSPGVRMEGSVFFGLGEQACDCGHICLCQGVAPSRQQQAEKVRCGPTCHCSRCGPVP